MGNRKVYIDFVDGNGYIDVSDFVKYDTLSIQEAAFNDTFHAAQNTCSFSVIYDASVYTKLTSAVVNLPLRIFDLRENTPIHTEADQPILTENNMRLLVESSIAVPVFAGHIPPQSSREYNGILDNIIVKINATDDLDLFDIPVGDIIYANCAVMNPTDPANSIVHKLAFSAGWSSSMIGEVSIPTIIARFAPSDAEATVRSVLDTLLFEYGYTLFLDEANKVSPRQWDVAIPSGVIPEFNEDTIIDEISIKHSINKYDGVKVIYYGLNSVNDMRLYRDANCGYASDGTFAGYSIANNTDYPPAANAIDETTGDKQIVYQEYTDDAIKYATNKAIQQNLDYNYKNYSSDFTSIVATENHYVDRRFEHAVTVVTETFGNKKCRLLYRNTTGSPVLLYYNDIYGTVWYKSAERTAVKNIATTPSDIYSYTSSYIFSKAIGDGLALAMAAQYKGTLKTYECVSEKDYFCGSIVKVVLTGEGTNVYALVKSKAWDEKNQQYTYTCISYNPIRESLTSQEVIDVGTINSSESYASVHKIGTPEAVQEAIDVKNTIFATIELAQAGAIIGDLFIDNGIMYRCTVAAGAVFINNSTRLTVKNFGKLASAPSTGMITNDTYYNTTNETQYYYDGTAWVVASSSVPSVVTTYTPKYLGKYLDAAPTTFNIGDWYTLYSTTADTAHRGVFVRGASTWSRTEDSKYLGNGAINDILIITTNVAYGTVSDYGATYINDLFSRFIKILTGGSIYGGDRFNSAGTEIDASKNGFYLGADGSLKAGGGSFTGTVNATDGVFTGDITSSGSMAYTGAGYQTHMDKNGITLYYPAGGGSIETPLLNDRRTLLKQGVIQASVYDGAHWDIANAFDDLDISGALTARMLYASSAIFAEDACSARRGFSSVLKLTTSTSWAQLFDNSADPLSNATGYVFGWDNDFNSLFVITYTILSVWAYPGVKLIIPDKGYYVTTTSFGSALSSAQMATVLAGFVRISAGVVQYRTPNASQALHKATIIS